MKGKTVCFMLSSVMLFSAGSGASANGGSIQFKGQIVSAGCEVQSLSGDQSVKEMQQIQVSAGVTIAINTYRNACSDDVIPFSTSYTELPSSGASVAKSVQTDAASRSGIVTLTYQ